MSTMKLDPKIKAKLEEHACTMLRCMNDLSDPEMRQLIAVEALRQAADWGWELAIHATAQHGHGLDVSGNRMGGG